MWYYSNR